MLRVSQKESIEPKNALSGDRPRPGRHLPGRAGAGARDEPKPGCGSGHRVDHTAAAGSRPSGEDVTHKRQWKRHPSTGGWRFLAFPVPAERVRRSGLLVAVFGVVLVLGDGLYGAGPFVEQDLVRAGFIEVE